MESIRANIEPEAVDTSDEIDTEDLAQEEEETQVAVSHRSVHCPLFRRQHTKGHYQIIISCNKYYI